MSKLYPVPQRVRNGGQQLAHGSWDDVWLEIHRLSQLDFELLLVRRPYEVIDLG